MKPTLLYISDPMCSWCWGFSPVIHRIHAEYNDRLTIEPILGGLRPGTTETLTEEWRKALAHHWHEVHNATAQPFDFGFNLPEDFRYDTEPACRAAVTVRKLKPESTLDYLHATHKAFYAENRDVTDPGILSEIAQTLGVTESDFLDCFNNDKTREDTVADFARSRSLGVNGFPAVLASIADHNVILTYGYTPYDQLKPKLEKWLEKARERN